MKAWWKVENSNKFNWTSLNFKWIGNRKNTYAPIFSVVSEVGHQISRWTMVVHRMNEQMRTDSFGCGLQEYQTSRCPRVTAIICNDSRHRLISYSERNTTELVDAIWFGLAG